MNFKQILTIIISLFLVASCKQTNEQLLDKAYDFNKQKKYDKAIETYTEIIKRNSKLQLAYYHRGTVYLATEKYNMALADFNKVMALQTHGDFIVTFNKDMPYAGEETRAQVPYNDALYQRALVNYFMDSLKSSFMDFQTLVDNDYEAKSNCVLWQGTIYVRIGRTDKACEYFDKAKQFALTDDERKEADEMIKTYCEQTNNNR